jgi:hypothetical protein
LQVTKVRHWKFSSTHLKTPPGLILRLHLSLNSSPKRQYMVSAYCET